MSVMKGVDAKQLIDTRCTATNLMKTFNSCAGDQYPQDLLTEFAEIISINPFMLMVASKNREVLLALYIHDPECVDTAAIKLKHRCTQLVLKYLKEYYNICDLANSTREPGLNMHLVFGDDYGYSDLVTAIEEVRRMASPKQFIFQKESLDHPEGVKRGLLHPSSTGDTGDISTATTDEKPTRKSTPKKRFRKTASE